MSQQYIVLTQLRGSIALAIRGAAAELTEKLDVPQPEADILTLNAVMCAIDAIVDLPTLTLDSVLLAIRVSVENEHANALAAMEKETQ